MVQLSCGTPPSLLGDVGLSSLLADICSPFLQPLGSSREEAVCGWPVWLAVAAVAMADERRLAAVAAKCTATPCSAHSGPPPADPGVVCIGGAGLEALVTALIVVSWFEP